MFCFFFVFFLQEITLKGLSADQPKAAKVTEVSKQPAAKEEVEEEEEEESGGEEEEEEEEEGSGEEEEEEEEEEGSGDEEEEGEGSGEEAEEEGSGEKDEEEGLGSRQAAEDVKPKDNTKNGKSQTVFAPVYSSYIICPDFLSYRGTKRACEDCSFTTSRDSAPNPRNSAHHREGSLSPACASQLTSATARYPQHCYTARDSAHFC